MKIKELTFVRVIERIKSATVDTSALNAKEVASILSEVGDVDLRRTIVARFMMDACTKGDVSEVVAWAVVMSHMEGVRPDPDVQVEAMHLITAH